MPRLSDTYPVRCLATVSCNACAAPLNNNQYYISIYIQVRSIEC